MVYFCIVLYCFALLCFVLCCVVYWIIGVDRYMCVCMYEGAYQVRYLRYISITCMFVTHLDISCP